MRRGRACAAAAAWLLASPAAAALGDATFLQEFGVKSPQLDGHFNTTTASAVHDATGDVWASDNRAQKFDRDGNFILGFPCKCAGLAVSQPTGDLYASDHRLHEIRQYDSLGQLIRSWGGFGSGPGQLWSPWGVATDSLTGEVYVNDTGNGRVQVFDASGAYLREFTHVFFSGNAGHPNGIAFDPTGRTVWVTDATNDVVLGFDVNGTPLVQIAGIEGNDPGELRWPRSVAVDSEGRVYVTDTDSERIQYFTPLGAFLGFIQGPNNRELGPFHPRDIAINLLTDEKFVNAAYAFRVDRFAADNSYELSLGDRLRDGNFIRRPQGISVSPTTGDVYVFDTDHFFVKRFTAGGAFLTQWGGSDRINPAEPGLFGPFIQSALTTDPDGNVWVGLIGLKYPEDPERLYIQKFDPDGVPLLSFVRTSHPPKYTERVRHLAIDPVTRDVYSSDSRLDRVQKLDAAGNLLLEIAGVGEPTGVALAGTDLYVADSQGDVIRRFDLAGALLGTLGSPGSGDGQLALDAASGLATDAAGDVYVADTGNDRIQHFAAGGGFLGKLGTSANAPGSFLEPIGVALSPDGNVLHVVDRGRHKVESFCLGDQAICEAQLDHDLDGHFDAADNCPFTANPGQEDAGDVGSTSPDGIGNVCQCGNVNADDLVDAADLAALRAHLAGTAALLAPDLCSVDGAPGCDIVDAAVTARALAELEPGIAQLCPPATR